MSKAPNEECGNADNILNAASQLFARQGIDATSIGEICDLAGVSRPVLYYYYGSKEGLIRAVVKKACHHLKALSVIAFRSQSSFREQCLTLLHSFFQDAIENPLPWRLVVAQIMLPSGDGDVACLCAEFAEIFGAAAQRAVERGEIEQYGSLIPGQVLGGAILVTITSYLRSGVPELTLELCENILDIVFGGLLKRESGLPPEFARAHCAAQS